MRLVLLIALVAGGAARADVSLDAPAPHTPLGPACDRALAAAQASFAARNRDIHFDVRQQQIVSEYRWSDMCGVWGDYSLVLAPDRREPQAWHWIERTRSENERVHRHYVKRAAGWRAQFTLEADSEEDAGDWFVEAFQPAVDICLASAARSR
jgi:hypothetical protein